VAYGRQLRSKTDMGDLVCSITKDGGKTWTPPIMIFDHRVSNGSLRFAYTNAVLFKDPDQNVLWLFCMRCPAHYRDSEDSQLCSAYSGDGGFSWHPVELAKDFHSPLITIAGMHIVKDQGKKRYLLPCHRNTRRHDPLGDRQQFILESQDLLRWKLGAYIPHNFEQKVFMHEGNIAEWETPDELKIIMRTADYQTGARALDPPRAYSSISKDGGRTWSPGEREPDLFNTVSKAFFGKDSHGNHVYVYSDGPAWERKVLRYKTKKPGGSWSSDRLFYYDDNRNSYPTLIEDASGQWLCVWDSSFDSKNTRTAIRFGRLTIE
jgi:hypothetical protein